MSETANDPFSRLMLTLYSTQVVARRALANAAKEIEPLSGHASSIASLGPIQSETTRAALTSWRDTLRAAEAAIASELADTEDDETQALSVLRPAEEAISICIAAFNAVCDLAVAEALARRGR